MKKAFRLEGLDCAHCADKIERSIQALDGVTSCSVNFMTTKMVIEGDDEKFDDIMDKAYSIIKKSEPDVVVKKG